MEWLLVAISIVLLLMNVLLMRTVKKQHTDEDSARVHESMAEFVDQLEKENDALYDKLITYIQESESHLTKRIVGLEQNFAPSFKGAETPEEVSLETEKIIQLSRQGFSSKQIAKVLQIDHGKVELVVKLNNKQQVNFKEDEVL
ncbi:hypothetical protein A1A1_00350 [Planococcus antarcticus DSM 14505]|uniref:Resolvase HTH domain-containing protein n=1 Tax=Planococcus antarcticus DSM 14505 TaxID=1185653 RepID=A0AA87LVG6_9BACL|nr:hypothetical protein [Planococcus antarcticus]EIM08502.1 hypothetical protein A1A1_00350 [Planococcus antarcticus DSM 14505]